MKVLRSVFRRSTGVELPVFNIEFQGKHSTPDPPNIEVPIRLGLSGKGYTEGIWQLKVRRAFIRGSRHHGREKFRFHDFSNYGSIDLIVQPGGVDTRRRAELIVPPEYRVQEVFEAFRLPEFRLETADFSESELDNIMTTAAQVTSAVQIVPKGGRRGEKPFADAARIFTYWRKKDRQKALLSLLDEEIVGVDVSHEILESSIATLVATRNEKRVLNLHKSVLVVEHQLFEPHSHRRGYVLTEKSWLMLEDIREVKSFQDIQRRQAKVDEIHRELDRHARSVLAFQERVSRKSEQLRIYGEELERQLRALTSMK